LLHKNTSEKAKNWHGTTCKRLQKNGLNTP